MRKLLPFVLVVVCDRSALAQQPYERYYLSAGSYRFNLLELASGNLFVAMGGAIILDEEGDPINNNYYWDPSMLNLQSVRKYTDNEFYFVTGYQEDSCAASGTLTIPYTHPVIGRMDSLGNVLMLHRYQLNAESCWNPTGDLEITLDKDIIAWGRDPSLFALRVDSTGEVEWARHFTQDGCFNFIKELPNGDLLGGMNLGSTGAVLARMDADGNLLWCKSYIRPDGQIHDCVIESDSSFIVTGVTETTSLNMLTPLPPDYRPKMFMMKLNGGGDVQWCKGYDIHPYRWYATQWSRIVKTSGAGYVLLANIGVHNDGLNYNAPYRPLLMETNMNGDTLWTRSAGINGYSYSTIDLLAGSHGDIFFNGTVYGDFSPWTGASYLFKADSLGHLPCSERLPPPVDVLDLFPSDSSIVLISVDGADAIPTFVADTVYGSIPVIDGCTIARVNTVHKLPQKPRVYPNPNTGRFTVEFADPLVAESYYSVYDALGKLLYQRPLPTGATLEEVDLSRYGRGTYAIKFTDPAGVCYERVVLE